MLLLLLLLLFLLSLGSFTEDIREAISVSTESDYRSRSHKLNDPAPDRGNSGGNSAVTSVSETAKSVGKTSTEEPQPQFGTKAEAGERAWETAEMLEKKGSIATTTATATTATTALATATTAATTATATGLTGKKEETQAEADEGNGSWGTKRSFADVIP